MKYNDVLNKYIDLLNCNSKELAVHSNISESLLSRYKNGSRVPSDDSLKKLSNGIAKMSKGKYTYDSVLNEFYKCSNNFGINIDFENVRNNLNTLITELDISANELAKYLNFDSSYLSRIRNGNRIPANRHEFINSITNFVIKKYNTEKQKKILINIMNCDIKNLNSNQLNNWLINNKPQKSNNINKFLKTIDEFNLNDYIKAIKFDKLKVPNIPLYKGKTKTYYGIEEMKKGELEFFKSVVLSKSKEDLFMYSNMPMEDMAKDIDFGKKWMFGIAMCLKKGLHLNIIHNIDRPFNEMMLGLESWIPIYMTGQISPYYMSDNNNNVYCNLNYISGSNALAGECVKGYHNAGKYYLTSNTKEVKYYKERCRLLLKKAKPLMEIYRIENQKDYNTFLNKDNKLESDRKRFLSSLPLFTINNKLLIKILKGNDISNDEINEILKYKKEEEKHFKHILKNNKITDYTYIFKKGDFENNNPTLSLENLFFNKKINYTCEEYMEHLEMTKRFSKENKNYKLISNDNITFKNITITILENNYVIISKSLNPIIHFVIKHPKLVSAIENFRPLVIEK